MEVEERQWWRWQWRPVTVPHHRVGEVHHRVVQLALARRHLAPLVGGVDHAELFDVLLRHLERRVDDVRRPEQKERRVRVVVRDRLQHLALEQRVFVAAIPVVAVRPGHALGGVRPLRLAAGARIVVAVRRRVARRRRPPQVDHRQLVVNAPRGVGTGADARRGAVALLLLVERRLEVARPPHAVERLAPRPAGAAGMLGARLAALRRVVRIRRREVRRVAQAEAAAEAGAALGGRRRRRRHRAVARLHRPVVVGVVEVVERDVIAAAARRVVGRRHPGVPLTEHRRRVARRLHLRCDAGHVPRDRREAGDRVGGVGDVGRRVERVDVVRVAPALQRRARRRAVLVHVGAIELDPLGDERVHVRRLHLGGVRHELAARRGGVAVPAGVGPAEVVEEDHQDMWLLTAGRRREALCWYGVLLRREGDDGRQERHRDGGHRRTRRNSRECSFYFTARLQRRSRRRSRRHVTRLSQFRGASRTSKATV